MMRAVFKLAEFLTSCLALILLGKFSRLCYCSVKKRDRTVDNQKYNFYYK